MERSKALKLAISILYNKGKDLYTARQNYIHESKSVDNEIVAEYKKIIDDINEANEELASILGELVNEENAIEMEEFNNKVNKLMSL